MIFMTIFPLRDHSPHVFLGEERICFIWGMYSFPAAVSWFADCPDWNHIWRGFTILIIARMIIRIILMMIIIMIRIMIHIYSQTTTWSWCKACRSSLWSTTLLSSHSRLSWSVEWLSWQPTSEGEVFVHLVGEEPKALWIALAKRNSKIFTFIQKLSSYHPYHQFSQL